MHSLCQALLWTQLVPFLKKLSWLVHLITFSKDLFFCECLPACMCVNVSLHACVSVFACMYVCAVFFVFRRVLRIPQKWSYRRLWYGLNPGPLQEQPILLTSELSLETETVILIPLSQSSLSFNSWILEEIHMNYNLHNTFLYIFIHMFLILHSLYSNWNF